MRVTDTYNILKTTRENNAIYPVDKAIRINPLRRLITMEYVEPARANADSDAPPGSRTTPFGVDLSLSKYSMLDSFEPHPPAQKVQIRSVLAYLIVVPYRAVPLFSQSGERQT